MERQVRFASALLLACLIPAGVPHAFGQEISAPSYRIKPSDVVVPPNVELGNYQRIIRPFENWTLICDENLQARTKVCNVSQIIEDVSGKVAFSWSLAATNDGKPYMILRTQPNAKGEGLVSLKFEGRSRPVEVHIDGCNEAVCVGMLPVGPIMREQISRDAIPAISYATNDGQTITVTASLKGLAKALAAIE